ncbi:MAG: ABC transporter ATP-binding protein/permease [Bacilli bacterium]|nr:ABC transporter ATP-binding protein/permease [Bacilli bacterium]MDY6430313.1 ABC transporter ATP-binding protein/permease [Bacilli bacterium]
MLKLVNIVKDYVSGNNVTHALKGVSINFRRNEMVAILGQSGCGKTTLLNITGGLDRYTSGDLIIEGKSTATYKDRDWDTYRNHSIGFVFQSYNLIMHQNIAKNVELALTISGVSKKERKERALAALEMVGLGGLGKKKPNQLSGGQMQRVAIARALVNNPEIVMADEPTGALDSETSIQIMDLLKEVAKDRLVIMVTHNPDLAEKYATRIITMKDGLITSDSNPYNGETEAERNAAHERKAQISKGRKKRTSMSFFTATGLSLSNLRSKLKRTILVTIAGSIGIIGVSAVLAVSQGVRDYIGGMENDMLSSYPIKIEEKSVDITSLLNGLTASKAKEAFQFDPKNPKIGMDSMIDYLMKTYSDMTKAKTNEINDWLLDYLANLPENSAYASHLNYGIDVTNNVFGRWNSDPKQEGVPPHYETISLNGLTQRYIAELSKIPGFGKYAQYVNLFTDFMHEFPIYGDYIRDQYDFIGEDKLDLTKDAIYLVVDENTTLTDFVLAQMGIYDHDEFINIAKRAIKINQIPSDISEAERKAIIEKLDKECPYRRDFPLEEVLGRKYLYFPQSSIYSQTPVEVAQVKEVVSVFVIDTTGSRLFSLTYDEDTDTINGTIVSMAGGGLSYQASTFVRDPASSKPASWTDKKVLVYDEWFAYDKDAKLSIKLNLKNAASNAVTIYDVKDDKTSGAIGIVNLETQQKKGYAYKAELPADMIQNPENYGGKTLEIAGVLRLKKNRRFGSLNTGVYYTPSFGRRYINDSNLDNAQVTKAFQKYIGSPDEQVSQFNAYVTFDYWDYSSEPIQKRTDGYAVSLNGDLSNSIADLFSAFTGGLNYFETDKVHLRSLCGRKIIEIVKEENSETKTTYEFGDYPYGVSIYPKSFGDKDRITSYLDRWNSDDVITLFKGTPQQIDTTRQMRKELSYVDTLQLIVVVIDTLITAITTSLVAFTSLALVVSCFMIAVITYISVVERIKEIGIIRSVGGRKMDVSRLFIAETFMTGLFSGVFGILMTYLFQVIFNAVMFGVFGISGIANLTIVTAIIMIAISAGLSIISGLIPSLRASSQDPVIALRSSE